MKALLLAAGLGTRLSPITNTVPKCLVPVNGKPLLEYWLDNLTKVGIKEFLINTSYLAKEVEIFVQNSKYVDCIKIVHEETLLNTGGTVLANKKFLYDINEPFMLIHADNLSFCNFKYFIDAHKNRPKICDITMMLFKTDNPSNCGIVEIDNNGIVQKFYEKVQNPPSMLANGAVYICESTIFDFLDTFQKENIDFSNEVLPKYMGRINTFLNDVYHRDIGTIESYAISQVEILKLNNILNNFK